MNQNLQRKIKKQIHDTFAIKIDPKPNKITVVQSKFRISKKLMAEASKKVIPIMKEYLQGKGEYEKRELKEFAQIELEKEFEEFMKG
ncbi:hypothetical protein QYS49_32425 [Marivirga salinae]|uniref:Uncharacterized protein n=1 Tax=Marivirga salinarum TaxID=3059078 RepID=A0AA51NBD4_9BACT|nr:hypothetical protein [Marivirga sp. BDSF4-3]WMN12102.1 hypothetical protein QYS49_32425 [Marivirga sp. BDSF4-3]